MALASSLLHKSSMTKKRVKFGLAILGALSVFLLALLALVFAPTGASAGKGPVFGQEQDGGHSGHSNPIYFVPPDGTGVNNNSHHTNDGGANPCLGTPNPCEAQDDHGAPGQDSWLYGAGGEGNGANPGDGGHSPNHDSGDQQGGHGNQPPLFVAGYPGGGGNGAPQGQSSSCSSKKDKDQDAKDKESDNKSCKSDDDNNDNNNSDNSGSGNNGGDAGNLQSLVQNTSFNDPKDGPSDDGDTSTNLLDNDPPPGDDTDDDLPPVDPNCFPFTEGCDTHGGNPPNTDLTDPPNKVPEPLTLSLFAVGLTGAAALRRRARQKTAVRPD